MSKYYEIVIFTAALQDYADWVLDQLDTKKKIKYRLYRQHATPNETNYIKDLSRIGRPLSRIIIIDNLSENFQLQPDNGIMIRSWFDNPQDTALSELAPILKGNLYLYYRNCNKKSKRCKRCIRKILRSNEQTER